MKNKLCKYLMFNIQVKHTTEHYVGDLVSIDIYGNILVRTHARDETELGAEDVKPILRPFEHLTKELPLTKVAAEMIGKKEGEMVIPIQVASWMYFGGHRFIELINWGSDYVDFSEDLQGWFSDEFIENNILIDLENKKCLTIKNGTYKSFFSHHDCESYRDFLRAMGFNLDFNEGEFIKLED